MTDHGLAPVTPGHREVGGTSRVTLHRFASPGLGSVNNYWLETPHSVVVFDAQRQLSQARDALASIRRLQKPIRAIILSHEHPDHLGGLSVFSSAAEPDVAIHASAETRASVAADLFGYVPLARAALGDDFPHTVLQPTATLEHGQVLDIDGVALQVHEFGPGEAASMTGLRLDDGQMLVADVLVNRMTPFLLEGRVLRWMDQLRRFAQALPGVRTVFPGHGDSGSADELLSANLAYLGALLDLVRAAQEKDGALGEAARDHIVEEMERRYSGYLPVAEIPGLMAMNVDALARELSSARTISDA